MAEIFADNYFRKKYAEEKIVAIYGSKYEYYTNLKGHLTQQSFTVYYFTDDFERVVNGIIKLKPLFIILAFPEKQNDIIRITRFVRENSPGTHIILQLPLKILASLDLDRFNVAGIISDNAKTDEILECLNMILKGYRFLGKDLI